MATQVEVLRVTPVDGGSVYDLYMTEYSYKDKKGKSLLEHSRGSVQIRGTVDPKYLPSNGGTFRMLYISVSSVAVYGSAVIKECKNVIEKEEGYYFEAADGNKYLLFPTNSN